MSQPWPVLRPRRARPPVWLVTFDDLCLLLMAFFVRSEEHTSELQSH